MLTRAGAIMNSNPTTVSAICVYMYADQKPRPGRPLHRHLGKFSPLPEPGHQACCLRPGTMREADRQNICLHSKIWQAIDVLASLACTHCWRARTPAGEGSDSAAYTRQNTTHRGSGRSFLHLVTPVSSFAKALCMTYCKKI